MKRYRYIPGAAVCGKCGAEYPDKLAIGFDPDAAVACGHTVRDVDRIRTIQIPLGNGKRPGRPIEILRENVTRAFGCRVNHFTLTIHDRKRRRWFKQVVDLDCFKDKRILESVITDAWRALRNQWREAVVPGWRERYQDRMKRRFEARRELLTNPAMFGIGQQRAERALVAAGYDAKRALRWLALSGYLGRDATWSELKEAE